MPVKQRAARLSPESGMGHAAPLVRHWLRQQQSERLGVLSEVRVLTDLLSGLHIRHAAPLPDTGSADALLQEMRYRSERLLGRLSPRAAPFGLSAGLVQYVAAWREAHPESMNHLSIAEELAELSSPYASLLIDGLELFLGRLIASGGVPRFSLVAALDAGPSVKMTLCSFGKTLNLGDGADLSVGTLALQLRSVGGELAYIRDPSIGSVLQLQLPM